MSAERLATHKVAVIIPHYNDLANLAHCLDAIAAQSFPAQDFEIVVVDNDSPIDVAELEGCVAGRARILFETTRGAGPARNRGVIETSAPLLAFIDSDCVADPEWLAAGVSALDKADFTGGPVHVSTQFDQDLSGAEAFERLFAFNNESYIRKKGFSGTGNLFMRREVYEQTGSFRAGVPEDMEWCHRATAKGFRLAYTPDAVVTHPARKNWPELHRKWMRVMRESHTYAKEQGRMLSWLMRSWLLPASILPGTARILLSGASLPNHRSRLRAFGTLLRLRSWRLLEAHRLAFGAKD